ncbi:GTP-binding protein [Ralstonia solanacearum]|uniref:GTP-binding protein n=1 Tax=Ralstonia solanacearum TaxID=305 RepID=UPI0005ACB183|nr:GTPase [Ralstonia solanacearum]
MHRIGIFGAMGIGKTTAIRSLCGDVAVDCDVPNLDRQASSKATTTVGIDFGEVDLGDGELLQIYGSPGQDRFDFLRDWLISVIAGAIVMVDVNAPDTVQTSLPLLERIAAEPNRPPALVLVARPATVEQVDAFSAQVSQALGYAIPVVFADVRDRAQMLDIVEIMLYTLQT